MRNHHEVWERRMAGYRQQEIHFARQAIQNLRPALYVPCPVSGLYGEAIFHEPVQWRMRRQELQRQDIAFLGCPELLRALQAQCQYFCRLWRQEFEETRRTGVRIEPSDYEQQILLEEQEVAAMVDSPTESTVGV